MSIASMDRCLLLVAGLAIPFGFSARFAGMPQAAGAIWAVPTALTLLRLSVSVARSLLNRKLGVDIIALLAMGGALLLNEYLAGAVIAVMLLGGHALEDLAQSRAKRDLSALLRRAPSFTHRYDAGTLTTINVEDVRRGDVLLVKPGEVVPVDGVVANAIAVLDEAALTGEALPVQRRRGEQVRSGAVNTSGTPFDLRAIATSEGSTYAGIIRLVRLAQESPFRGLPLRSRTSAGPDIARRLDGVTKIPFRCKENWRQTSGSLCRTCTSRNRSFCHTLGCGSTGASEAASAHAG